MLLDTGWDSWVFLCRASSCTSVILVSVFQLGLSYESLKWFLVCHQRMGTVMIAGWRLKGEFYFLVLSKCFESSSVTARCLGQWDVHHDSDFCVPGRLPGKSVTVHAMDVGWKRPCSSLNAATYLKKNNVMENSAVRSRVHLKSLYVFQP